jgi:hypothetical protein
VRSASVVPPWHPKSTLSFYSQLKRGQDDGIDLDTVADELYGLAPPEFTSRRDARAAEARKGGDKGLAAEIKKLRRPTTGAWLANLLARERPDQVGQLLDLGTALRQAQATLATDDLRRLSQERHGVLAALSKEAHELAGRHGQAVSDATAKEVEATLEAALADSDAGDALRTGRLTTGLRYFGLGLVAEISDAEISDNGISDAGISDAGIGDDTISDAGIGDDTISDDGAPTGAKATEPPDGERGQVENDRRGAAEPDQARLAEAKQVLLNAQAALAEAEWDAGQKQRRLEEVQEERDRYQAQVTDMEQQLKALREGQAAAEHKLRAAQEALGTAQNAARAARGQLERAQAAADRTSP